jgi:hypothetical protein
MATRSFIALESNGLHSAIYCHWDGYPEGVGATLNTHYNDIEKVKQLLAKGYLSSLGETLEESEFYVDRGEKLRIRNGLLFEELKDHASSAGAEYLYTFRDDKWNVLPV